MIQFLAILSFFMFNFAMGTPKDGPLQVDQIEYFQKLKSARPELITPETCKPNLILKPQYRERVLSSKESAKTIIEAEYTPEKRAQDLKWADSHRAAMAQFMDLQKPQKGGTWIQVANYKPSEYVGFYFSRAKKTEARPVFADKQGIGFKLFFQPKDYLQDLKPSDALAFADALSAAGYQGDFKIPMTQEKIRFYFNNIVVHAKTKADALLAEKVGKKFFADRIATTGRGVDVDVVRGKKDKIDWSQFLCKYEMSDIPQYALDYVLYKDVVR